MPQLGGDHGRMLVGAYILLAVATAAMRATAATDPALALLTAARKGDVAAVRAALAGGAGVNATDPDFDQTALIRAAMFGQADAARVLIAAGADVNKTSNLGRTALHWAATAGAAEVASVLLSARAIVDVKDGYDETPLGYAADAGQVALARVLLAAGARADRMDRPLADRLALVLGNGVQGPPLDVLRTIIASRQGLEVETTTEGHTPLIVVADRAHRENTAAVARELLAAGANLVARDSKGRTALDLVNERLAWEKDDESRRNLEAMKRVLESKGAR